MPIKHKIEYRGAELGRASKALILLHGRGSTADDILSIADEFCDDSFHIAAPEAPHHAWYPYSFMEEEKNNEPYLSASIKIVKDLLDTIASHIPKSQIYLMGFSQGACLSLEIATRFATQYAGVVAFSGGLIGSILDEKKYHGDFNGTKVFIGISEQDPHVPLMRVEESAQLMRNLNANVTVMSYKGTSHTINDDEIHWVKENMFSL